MLGCNRKARTGCGPPARESPAQRAAGAQEAIEVLKDVYTMDLSALADIQPLQVEPGQYDERYLEDTLNAVLYLDREGLIELTRALVQYTVDQGLLAPGLSLHEVQREMEPCHQRLLDALKAAI